MDLDWASMRDVVAAIAAPLGIFATWLAGCGSRDAQARITQLEEQMRAFCRDTNDELHELKRDTWRRIAEVDASCRDHHNRIRNLERVASKLLRESGSDA